MRLRVVTGLEAGVLGGEALPVLYRGARVRVEGSADVLRVALDGEGEAFLAGDVVGVRTRTGDLSSCRTASDLRPFIGAGVERCRGSLEGRWILVVVRTDGSVEVGADRFGRADVYYRTGDGGAGLATALDLLPVDASAGYDQMALAHVFCVYGYRPPKRHTLYRGARRLGVGETARLAGGRLQLLEADFRPVRTAAFGERELHEYADIFLETLHAHGSRHGNVVYLSSGWDSTSILAGLVKLYGARRVRAVTGRMQYSERAGVINQFEIDRAQAIAQYYGVRLDVVDFDFRQKVPEIFEQFQPTLAAHQLAGGTVISHGVLAEFTARTSGGDETVFAGEISDGAHNLGFSQYATIFHPVLEFREYADKMGSYLLGPSFFRLFQADRFRDDPIYDLFRRRCGAALFDDLAAAGPPRSQQFLAGAFLRANRIPLWSLRNSPILTEAGRESYAAQIEREYLERAAADLSADNLYGWDLHLYNRRCLRAPAGAAVLGQPAAGVPVGDAGVVGAGTGPQSHEVPAQMDAETSHRLPNAPAGRPPLVPL